MVVAINPAASFGRGSEVGPAVVTTLRGLGHEVTSLTEPDFAQLLVAVANNLSFGGGMKVAPDASLYDGLFDVVLVRPLGRLAFLRIYPRVFAGTHVTDSRVVVHRARQVRIEADGVVAYADGERIAPLPVEIHMQEGSLRVLA